MATYKVLQDVEAEDKLVGPLTLRQFIYAGIGALSAYLGFLCATKGAAFMLAVFLPITGITGFFAFPWGQDQPTEVWALAKIRFFLKPRRRIWDQGGTKELVTITVPKKIEHQLTNGLNQDEVASRLQALANTIDSRGWAVKNVNVNLSTGQIPIDASDRLVQASSLPQEVSNIDIRADDDMLDESANPIAQHFDSMIQASSAAHRQQLITRMQQGPQPVATAANPWFMPATPQPTVAPGSTSLPPVAGTAPAQAAAPRPSQTASTAQQFMMQDAAQRAAQARAATTVTPESQAAIMNLANNDDLDVATLARQAHRQTDGGSSEVIVPLR